MKVLLGISGASGATYGVRTLSLLLARGADLHVLVTKTAWGILAAEVWDGALPGGMDARRKGLARLSSSARPFRLYAETISGSRSPPARTHPMR